MQVNIKDMTVLEVTNGKAMCAGFVSLVSMFVKWFFFRIKNVKPHKGFPAKKPLIKTTCSQTTFIFMYWTKDNFFHLLPPVASI